MYDPYAQFTQSTLSNGLKVYSVFWDRPWVTVDTIVHCGGREDPADRLGLAHYVEHLVSHNIPGWEYDAARDFLKTSGGWGKFGSTTYSTTRYRFCVPTETKKLRGALNIFGSMLLGARIENSIECERQVITREFNERYPFHEKLEWDLAIRRALFKGHRLETWNRPLGRPEGFLPATEVDLQDFYDKYYAPVNTSLVIVGGLQTSDLMDVLERSPFGIHKGGVRNLIPQPLKQIPAPVEKAKIVRMSDYSAFKVDRTEFKAVWAFPSDFPNQARRVFDRVLRRILFEEIRRKRGLTYGVAVEHTNFHDVCEYVIECKVDPSATQQIEELVRECIELVPQRSDLFECELEALKNNCSIVDCSTDDLVDYSAEGLSMFGRIITVGEILEGLQRVTHDQMAKAAGILSREQQYTFISHP
jgi:predicted Zn-dependent peptidase